MTKILTRYGDGSAVELTEAELMEDLIAGTEDAADRGNIPVMTQDDLNHLADIFKCTHRWWEWIPDTNVFSVTMVHP